jgi:tight adherence protein B
MDPVILLIVGGAAALAATLTLAVWRTLTRPGGSDRFEDALAKMTGLETFDGDTATLASAKGKGRSWNEWWAAAFEEAGRPVADRQSPGRIALGLVILTTFFGIFVYPTGVYAVAAPLVGLGGLYLWLNMARSQRRNRLDKQLPLLLAALRNQMQAGVTIQGAIAAVADDLPSPIGEEMRIVKADMAVAVPLDQSLTELAHRTQSRLVRFLVSSIGVANRSGSDLVPQLVVIEETVRQRARIAGKIKSAIALAKPTAYLAMAAPPLMGGYLFFSDPAFGQYFFSPDGILMLGIALGLYAAGAFTVYVMVSNVEKV